MSKLDAEGKCADFEAARKGTQQQKIRQINRCLRCTDWQKCRTSEPNPRQMMVRP